MLSLETGVVIARKKTSKSTSKAVSLKVFCSDNEAVREIIKTFDLEEGLSF